MSVRVANDVPDRPVGTYAHENGSQIQAHRVTDESAGEVQTVSGTRKVSPGDVLVATSRPDVWDVYTDKEFGEMGLTEDEKQADVFSESGEESDGDVQAVDEERFNPQTHTVDEVNRYLDTADKDERERVLSAERVGRARSGIVNR